MTDRNELRAEIEIDADPDRVWAVLMDFEAYPEWNPFIHADRGRARSSEPGCACVSSRADSRGITMTPLVTVIEPGSSVRMAWDRSGCRHIFDGAHRFELEPIDGGRRTRFVQSERFRGVLLPFVRRSVLPPTLRGSRP